MYTHVSSMSTQSWVGTPAAQRWRAVQPLGDLEGALLPRHHIALLLSHMQVRQGVADPLEVVEHAVTEVDICLLQITQRALGIGQLHHEPQAERPRRHHTLATRSPSADRRIERPSIGDVLPPAAL